MQPIMNIHARTVNYAMIVNGELEPNIHDTWDRIRGAKTKNSAQAELLIKHICNEMKAHNYMK